MRRLPVPSPTASGGPPAGHAVTVVTCAPHHPRGVLYPGYRNVLRQIEYVDGVRVVRWPHVVGGQ